jgi:sec-independent protein translocase protein TatA
MLNMFAMIGPETAMIVFAAILVLFGGSKIPQLMRGIGQGVGELKKGMEEGQRTIMAAANHEDLKVEEAKRLEQAPVVSTPAPGPTTTS